METLSDLAATLGPRNCLTESDDIAPYAVDWRGTWHGTPRAVLRPGSTEEVSRILAIANETRTAIIPQSGNTGLCGGQTPTDEGHEVLVSLDRMTRIIDVDPLDNTITVEAGAILKSVQEAAAAVDRVPPAGTVVRRAAVSWGPQVARSGTRRARPGR